MQSGFCSSSQGQPKSHFHAEAWLHFTEQWHVLLHRIWAEHALLSLNVLIRGFINVFSWRATGFHRWAKLFELWTSNITKTFLLMIKPGKQNHPHSLSICLVLALDETPAVIHCKQYFPFSSSMQNQSNGSSTKWKATREDSSLNPPFIIYALICLSITFLLMQKIRGKQTDFKLSFD